MVRSRLAAERVRSFHSAHAALVKLLLFEDGVIDPPLAAIKGF
jgi:hypothetical protein